MRERYTLSSHEKYNLMRIYTKNEPNSNFRYIVANLKINKPWD
ncbi:Hypothetical protein I595_339 [Croceitalea dokdonensis DOKDO 023]|uniref:Uncharacterized protein n=1 Tax=Croceitalea dokdonensis DOKDO 023 TaxID=1300341 RepID=A0A0N8H4I1_9FLAO|nr:Hypothetical protein I595_339 [Croceitalea dokdonensis DOKDO 023]